MFIQALRMYIFNKLINRIPFACIRMPLIRLYVNIGNDSNILTNVEILNRSLKKNQIVIGNNSVINSYCLLDGRIGRICIGDNVDIARETNIFTLEHDLNSDFHDTKSGDVIIEDYVWISSRVTILPGVKIGKGAVVASNAVVTRNVAPMTIVGGIPAKKIGERKSKLTYIIKHFPFLS
ncbi:MAG: acyltransferase [Candidatus Omnitrophica bacterium]|nr:acyltransferase [Candidatus Omnitrophota bacterium]